MKRQLALCWGFMIWAMGVGSSVRASLILFLARDDEAIRWIIHRAATGELPLDVVAVRQHSRTFLLERVKTLAAKRGAPSSLKDFRDFLDFQTATFHRRGEEATLSFDLGGEGRLSSSSERTETLIALRTRFYGEWRAFAFFTELLDGGVSRNYLFEPGENLVGERLLSFFPRLVTRYTGYLSAGAERVNVQVGRFDAAWGVGRSGTLVLSPSTDPKDGVRFAAHLGPLRFESLTAAAPHVGTESYFSAHRLSLLVGNHLLLTAYEGVLYKDRLELAYLNPVNLYLLTVPALEEEKGLESSEAFSGDNLFFGGEVLWRPLKGWLLYIDGMIDDFQAREGTNVLRDWDTKFALQGGTYLYHPGLWNGSDLRVEYTFVNQYAYTHEGSGLNYTLSGRPLGYWTGPDADNFWLEASTLFKPRWRAGVSFRLTRKGETTIEDVHQPGDPLRWAFLSGVVETTFEPSLFLTYTRFGRVFASARGFFRSVRNDGHRQGILRSSVGVELRLQATL